VGEVIGRENYQDSSMRNRPAVASFEDGGRDHESRKVDNLYELEKAKKQILPQSPQKRMHPTNTLS